MYRQRRGNTGAILLLLEIFNIGTKYIPPVTLFVTFVNLLMYMDIFNNLPNVDESCCSYFTIFQIKQYYRLFLCSIVHADDWHLYYNMISFIFKGIQLEPKLKSPRFSILLIVFTISTNILTVILYQIIFILSGNQYYRLTCCVGFSSIIFALKIVLTFQYPDMNHFMGIKISPLFNILSELFIISLLSPTTSFIGHLSGVIIGCIYVSKYFKRIINI